MHRFLAAMILTASLAPPAFAQSRDPDLPSGKVGPAPYGADVSDFSIYRHGRGGLSAYARHHGAIPPRPDGHYRF
jgi:hypothetical protein